MSHRDIQIPLDRFQTGVLLAGRRVNIPREKGLQDVEKADTLTVLLANDSRPVTVKVVDFKNINTVALQREILCAVLEQV